MIQIEAVHIRELRGIRTLDLTPERKNFVISGPNGSGKSGVVDAIQFGLTGEISRLSGRGTVGLTVLRHGPHVDRRDDPSAAEVSLTLFVPETNQTVVLTRNIKTAKVFALTPNDPKIRSILEDVARHPELTLSRREIIKFILVEAGQRSREIEALLQLDDVTALRRLLLTARNRLSASQTIAQAALNAAADALRRHLDIPRLSKEDVLAAVNPQRNVLGLADISEFTADTLLNVGVLEGGARPAFNKVSALRDLEALSATERGFQSLGRAEADAILHDISSLEADSALLQAVTQRAFVERGLALVAGAACPLCDTLWDDAEHLTAHLRSKLDKSKAAEVLQQRMLANASAIAGMARRLSVQVSQVEAISQADATTDLTASLTAWAKRLLTFAGSLGTLEDTIAAKEQLQVGWISAPEALAPQLAALTEAVRAKPDQSASVAAQNFLTLAQDRLTSWRTARRAIAQATAAATRGADVYKAYCDVMEEELTGLYTAVEGDFSAFYRDINSDDEAAFKAKLEASEGKLDLSVAFYDKGMFPPGAYHSEGHQDGMGVCLYLALMKRVLGPRFRFAVLDDVVMSVDQGHRKQFCSLLKVRFPDTQFIITTHDKVWAKQMQVEGLVDSKGGVVFHSWSPQAGPVFEQLADVWMQIDQDLTKNDVSGAAAKLRRHLEFISAELADLLGARPPFRGDFSYDLGDLFQSVVSRHGELLKAAARSAQDWNDADAKAKIEGIKKARAASLEMYGDENWIVNKAVHYNEWAQFTPKEFRDVVDASKALLLQWRCTNTACDSWLYVTPRRGTAESLRCRCMAFNLNLKSK